MGWFNSVVDYFFGGKKEPAVEPAVEQATAKLVSGFEGFSPAPYQDVGGVWTIGYGSTRDADNKPISADTPAVSENEAINLLARDLYSAFQEVVSDVKTPLTATEEEALASFIYNVGAGNFRSSTLLRLLNAGDLAGAAAQFPLWDHVGGKVIAGLLTRRLAEQRVFEA